MFSMIATATNGTTREYSASDAIAVHLETIANARANGSQDVFTVRDASGEIVRLDLPRTVEPAPVRIMPVPWRTAYAHARKNGAPSLACYIAQTRYEAAHVAGDLVNAAKWNRARVESFSARACAESR